MFFFKLFRLKNSELILLLRNLGVMLKAGVPLVRAIELCQEYSRGARKALLTHIRQQVEAGYTLSSAMETAGRAFPPIAINLIKTGEIAGTLEANLQELVTYLTKSQDLKRKIRSAMMYPTFVMVAVTGLGLSVGTLVLPKLIPLFESLDVDLPTSTKVLLWLAQYFEVYGILTSGIVITTVIIIILLTRIEAIRHILHAFLLTIPYLRTVQKYAINAQIGATLSSLLKSGIPLSDAMAATADSTTNLIYRAALRGTIPFVESGRTLSESLKHEPGLFPNLTTTLISIGEETGTLADTLQYLTSYYESEVDYAVKNLTTALEPALLIGIGIVVGFTVLAIITPIYDITATI